MQVKFYVEIVVVLASIHKKATHICISYYSIEENYS